MGVIGVGLGTHKAQIIKDSGCWYGFPYGDMNGISGTCIGWWDASDVSTLYQNVSGTTPVSAAGQAVHRIKNKAISTDKLGEFLVVRSPSSSPAVIPQYKEGGLNENSYLEIQANSKGYYSSKASGAGGVTDGSVFSNATVNNQAFTTFTVIRSGTQTGSTTLDKPAFVADGKTSGTVNEVHETIIADTTNQKWTTRIGIDAGATTSDIQSALTGADEFEGILITNVNSTGATSRLRINQAYTEEVYGTIAKQADFVMADGRVTICGHCQDDTCSSMEQGFNPGAQWYEQIVFNIKLTEEEIKCIEDYLMAKYNILPVMSDLVGWWDFSNVTTLYQSVGNYTSAITADGQTIGTVQNLALGDSNGDKLGSFLRSWSNDAEFKPVYKTGGQNAKSYAQFNTTSDTTTQKRMLFAGGMQGSSDFTTTGGETATLFSDLVLNNRAQTVFTVWKNDLNDYNNGQVMYSVNGHDAGGAASNSFVRFMRSFDESNDIVINTNSSAVEWINTPNVSHNDANHHFTMFRLGNMTNQSYVKTDFVQEATGSTSNQVCDFDTNSQTGTYNGTPAVNLGAHSNSIGTYNDNSVFPWVGRIYEVLHYARALTPIEIAGVENYLAVKYAPGPQTFVVNELVGWWDFTDNESMFQTNAGATAVIANNDPIGRIMNKADGDLLGNKLGLFLKAYDNTTAYRPVFKTGGVNGLTYGEFGNGVNTGLRAGFFGAGDPASDDGGVSATLFSDLKLNSNSQTVYAVVERTGSSTSQADLLTWAGLNGAGTNLAIGSLLKTAGATTGYQFNWIDAAPINFEMVSEPDGPPSGLDIIKIVGASTASMVINGAQQDTEVLETAVETDFSSSTGGTGTSPVVTLGNQTLPATGATLTQEWIGKIYEVFVWNKTLNGSEQAAMDTYLINKYGQVGEIVPVSEAVAHYDFTVASTMTQTIGGTTAVTADGDRIGRINNLAPGDENAYKLGEYLNAPFDTNVRPVYKTGGINSKTYAKFYEGSDHATLRAGNFNGVDSTTTGGISADVFTNLPYNQSERTIFMMLKEDLVNAPTYELWLKINGKHSGNNARKTEEFYRSNAGNQQKYGKTDLSGENIPFQLNGTSVSQVNDQPVLFASRNTYTNTEIFLNTNQEGNSIPWGTNPVIMDMTAGTDGANRPYITIGSAVSSSGASTTGANYFDGDIYEIIIFNKALTDSEMSQMNTYFQTKYALDFNTATLPLISDHVGHWDFSDASTMKQNRNNTTAVTADGNPIGRINNLAPGDASGDKLGAFLRSGADDATRPTYKTDGINGKSYAQFDPASGGQLLRTGFFTSAGADDDGGETATKFTDLKFNMLQSTVFIVVKNNDPTGGNQRMFMLLGVEDGESLPASMYYIYRKNAGATGTRLLQANTGGSFTGSIDTLENSDVGTGTHLFELKGQTSGVSITRDGTLMVNQTSFTGAWASDTKMRLDINNNGATQKFDIGSISLNSGAVNTGTTDALSGDIYEILVYNKVLSDDETAQVESYISAKYGITIS